MWQKETDEMSYGVSPRKNKIHLQNDGGESGDDDAEEGALARVVFLVVGVRLCAALAWTPAAAEEEPGAGHHNAEQQGDQRYQQRARIVVQHGRPLGHQLLLSLLHVDLARFHSQNT